MAGEGKIHTSSPAPMINVSIGKPWDPIAVDVLEVSVSVK